MRPKPGSPLSSERSLSFRRQRLTWLLVLDLGQYLQKLFFEPGMQHGIGSRENPLGPEFSGGWAKEGQQFGGASSDILMRLESGLPFGLPASSGLRNGLIGSCFILAENHHPGAFPSMVRLLNQGFFFLGVRIVDDDDALFAHP